MNTMVPFRSAVLLVMALAPLAAGCGASEDVDSATQLLASDGVSAVSASDHSTIGLTGSTFDLVSSADPALATTALASGPADPGDAGCRTRRIDPSNPHTVIVTLRGCTGFFGRRLVSGTEIVHFSAGAAGVLHADLHSENLTVDGQPATHTASADITFDGPSRHVTWQGAWQGTGPNGDAVSHTSDLTIDVDTTTHCRTRNGTAVTLVGGREIDSTITGVKVCRDADGDPGCPTGSVVHARQATGKQVSVVFDGTAEAVISTPRRGTFELPLVCKE